MELVYLGDVWREVAHFFAWLWSQWQSQFLILHIIGNVVVAVAVSIYTGDFLLGKLGEFLYKKILPLVLVYAAFAFIGETANLVWVATAAWAMLESLLLADLIDNLKKLGLPIPDAFGKG